MNTKISSCLLWFVSVVACAPERVPVGGLMIEMAVDPSVDPSLLTALDVNVSSSDGGTVYRSAAYLIGDAAPADVDATIDPDAKRVIFPTNLFIESNGDPSASLQITLSLHDATNGVDIRSYRVSDIPTETIAVLYVDFASRACAPESLNAGSLPAYGQDTGASACIEIDAAAAPDATFVDAMSGDTGDGSYESPEASTEPCDASCVEGQTHCVDGTCAAVPPSCAGGGPGAGYNCGGLQSTDDCCSSLAVPWPAEQGTFLRDYDGVTHTDESYPATVSRFRLDSYEVTVGRFRKFVSAVVGADAAAPWLPEAGSGIHAHLNGGQGLSAGGDAGTFEPGWNSNWNSYLMPTEGDWDANLLSSECNSDATPPTTSWTQGAGPNENLPIDCVTWYDAYAFCIWDGGFLPSASEWDYAAAAGSDQRVFAWGNELFNAQYAIYDCFYGAGPFGNDCLGLGNVAPVGSAPKGLGLWGQFDLNGSVYEWVFDSAAAYPNPCDDCANVAEGSLRVIRGGGFDSQQSEIESAFWTTGHPERRFGDVGFRCARVP